jgi:hypothetical protein
MVLTLEKCGFSSMIYFHILACGIFASMGPTNVYKNMLNNMVSPIDHVVMNHKNHTRTNYIWGHGLYSDPWQRADNDQLPYWKSNNLSFALLQLIYICRYVICREIVFPSKSSMKTPGTSQERNLYFFQSISKISFRMIRDEGLD